MTADVESDIVAPHWVVDEVADGSESGRDGKQKYLIINNNL